MPALHADYSQQTIQQLVNAFLNGQLNLEPGFQRHSVWSLSDRQKLIESICLHYPMPSIFLYKRQDVDGSLIYDVIDGKQRLESIFMFMAIGQFRREGFSARTKLSPSEEEADLYNWAKIRRKGGEFSFESYRIQTVEVCGELSDIIAVFVRINSTGKKLTSAERRHARYYNSPFLRRAGLLADRFESFYRQHRILSGGAITRMKHVELTCELMASIVQGGPINKKKALDDVIGGRSIEGIKLKKCTREFVRITNAVGRMFPRLQETRFANAVDYYSLFLLILELDRKGCVLNNPTRNRQAEKLLVWLTLGALQVRRQQKQLVGATPDQEVFREYLMTVQSDTDSQASRERRAQVLRGLLGGLFERKDERRLFSSEQRRLIWHSDGTKRCSHPECGVRLDWSNFTIDHIMPFAKGGRTSRNNAALMCKKHNSQKGAR